MDFAVQIIRNSIQLSAFIFLFFILDRHKFQLKKTLCCYFTFFLVITLSATAWAVVDYSSYIMYSGLYVLLCSALFFPFVSKNNPLQVIYNISLQVFILILELVVARFLAIRYFGDSPWADILFRLVIITVAVFVYIRYLQTPFRELRVREIKAWREISLVAFLGCIFVIYVWTQPQNILFRSDNEKIVFIGIWLLLFFGHIIMIRSLFVMSKLAQAKQIELHRDLLMSEVENQHRQTEAIRRNRHDLRHHNWLIAEFARSGDIAGLLNYLGELELYTDDVEMNYCENETLNNILLVYLRRAKSEGIETNVLAQARCGIEISQTDLVTIVANILENAIHGCMQNENSSRFIKLRIHEKLGKLVIHCENSCKRNLHFSEHMRGIGISSIENAAAHYSGLCVFDAKDGIFTCGVILNLS